MRDVDSQAISASFDQNKQIKKKSQTVDQNAGRDEDSFHNFDLKAQDVKDDANVSEFLQQMENIPALTTADKLRLEWMYLSGLDGENYRFDSKNASKCEHFQKEQKFIQNSVRVSTLSNGMRIVTAADKNSDLTSFSLSVDMGPQYEDVVAPVDKKKGIFRGITGVYAHIMNNILQNPSSDVEFKEALRQERKKRQLLQEIVKDVGVAGVTDEMYQKVMGLRFPTKAEKNSQKLKEKLTELNQNDLFATEFARHLTNQNEHPKPVHDEVVKGVYNHLTKSYEVMEKNGITTEYDPNTTAKTPVELSSFLKKTWREQLREGALPNTKWFVEPHKNHLTISAYSRNDKVFKILKILSLMLIHPDINEDDYKNAVFTIDQYWYTGDEPSRQVNDVEAITQCTQNLLYKAAYPPESPFRTAYQPTLKVLDTHNEKDVIKWHKMFFHNKNDPDFLTKFPLTLSITGVNSDNDHENVVAMCEQVFASALYSKQGKWQTPIEHQKKYQKPGALAQAGTVAKYTFEQPVMSLKKRLEIKNAQTSFQPMVWDSKENAISTLNPRYEGHMPTMALVWEDADELSLNKLVTQKLLNQTTFQSRKDAMKGNKRIPVDDDNNNNNNNNNTHSNDFNLPLSGALTPNTFTHTSHFRHTPAHSLVLKHLFGIHNPDFDLYADPQEVVQQVARNIANFERNNDNYQHLGHLFDDSQGEIEDTIVPFSTRIHAGLNKPIRTITPVNVGLMNSGLFGIIMTLKRSKQSIEIRKGLVPQLFPQLAQFITPHQLAMAKRFAIEELSMGQLVVPLIDENDDDLDQTNSGTNQDGTKYKKTNFEPNNTKWSSDNKNSLHSFFGTELLTYPKTLARHTQLYNTYLVPEMINTISKISLDEMKDVCDSIFKGSTRHDSLYEQSLPPVQPGIALLGVRGDHLHEDLVVKQFLQQPGVNPVEGLQHFYGTKRSRDAAMDIYDEFLARKALQGK
jgi:hypothetical protein